MIAYLPIALFAIALVAVIAVLADTMVRARNVVVAMRAEERAFKQPPRPVDVVKLRPAAAIQRSAMRRPAPRLPRAVAA